MVLSSGNSTQTNCSRTNSVVALSGKEQISPVLLLSDNAPDNHEIEIEQTHMANVIRSSLRNRRTMVSDKQCDKEPKFLPGKDQTNGPDYLPVMSYLPKNAPPLLPTNCKKTNLQSPVPRVFPCSECQQGFLSEANLQRHKNSHHSNHLSSDSKSPVIISKKLKKQSSADPTPTKVTKSSLSGEKSFKFEENLMLLSCKSGEKFFQCDICHLDFNLPKARELKIHYLRNHISYQFISEADRILCAIKDNDLSEKQTDQLFRCHTCQVSFSAKQELVKHNVEHQRSTYICDQCKAVFHQSKTFSNHLQMCTKTTEAITCSEPKSLLCLFCKKFYMVLDTEEQVALHTREFHCYSNGIWRGECMFGCSFKVKRPSMLFQHYCTSHKSEFFGCIPCKLRFTSVRLQKSHDLKHHNVKPNSPKLTCDTKVPLIPSHNTSNGGMKTTVQNNTLPNNDILIGPNGNILSSKVPLTINVKSSPSTSKPSPSMTSKPSPSMTSKPSPSTSKPSPSTTSKISPSTSSKLSTSSASKLNGTSTYIKAPCLKAGPPSGQSDKSSSVSKKNRSSTSTSNKLKMLGIQQKYFQNAFLKSITKMDIVQQVSVLKKHAEKYPDMFRLPDHQLFHIDISQDISPAVDLLEEEDFVRPVFTSSYENKVFICKACGEECSQLEDMKKHFSAAHPFIKNDHFVFDKADVPPNFWNLYCPAKSTPELKSKVVNKANLKCISCASVSKNKEDFHKHLLLCAKKSKSNLENVPSDKPKPDIPVVEDKSDDIARRKMVITGVVREVPDDPLLSFKLKLGKTINKPGDSETVYNMLNKLPSKRLVKTTERYNSLQYINNKAMKPKRSSAEKSLMNTKDSYVSLDEYIGDFVYSKSPSPASVLSEKPVKTPIEEKEIAYISFATWEELTRHVEKCMAQLNDEKKAKPEKFLITEDKNLKVKKPKPKTSKLVVPAEVNQPSSVPKISNGNGSIDLKNKIKMIKSEASEVAVDKKASTAHTNGKDLTKKSSPTFNDKKRKFSEVDKPNQAGSTQVLDANSACHSQESVNKSLTSNDGDKSFSKQVKQPKKLKVDVSGSKLATCTSSEKVGPTKLKKAVLVEKKNKQNTVKKKTVVKKKVKVVQSKAKSVSNVKVKNNKANVCDSNLKGQNKTKKVVKLK